MWRLRSLKSNRDRLFARGLDFEDPSGGQVNAAKAYALLSLEPSLLRLRWSKGLLGHRLVGFNFLRRLESGKF